MGKCAGSSWDSDFTHFSQLWRQLWQPCHWTSRRILDGWRILDAPFCLLKRLFGFDFIIVFESLCCLRIGFHLAKLHLASIIGHYRYLSTRVRHRVLSGKSLSKSHTNEEIHYNWTLIALLVWLLSFGFRFAYYAIGSAEVFDTIKILRVYMCTHALKII